MVAYLGEHPSAVKENSSINSRKPEIFENEYLCISKLLSIKEEVTYLIISATLAKLVIPLIHNHLCIEHIYIQQDHNGIQSVTWMDGYSKIQGTWASLQEIAEQMERDILSIETYPSSWSRTPDIFGELWTQKLSTTIMPSVSDDMKQRFKLPILVTLCSVQHTLSYLPKEGIETREFSVEEDCYQYIQRQIASSIFLLIIDDYNVISSKVESLVKYDSIHALYVFPVKNNTDKQCETISDYKSPKISGIFYNEKDLLLQMVADICFFRQISTYTPKMSMVKIEFDILSTLNEDKQAFLSFQFFIDVLKQLWCAPDVPSEISNQIKTPGTSLSADLYVNNTQLILKIDRLTNKFDPVSLYEASFYLRLINQQLECSIQKTYPFSITIYRVQLVSDNDLKAMEKNKNNLIAMHTFVLASRSFSSIKSICRRACDNGLTAVLFEINIPKMTPLTYLDSNNVIFPLSTVFKIKSIVTAPDEICHIQMEIANSTMDLINHKLHCTIGERLSWLTFGNYLAHIEKYDIAEAYFNYLRKIPLKSEESASIYNNIALMYLSIDGKDQETIDFLNKAEELTKSNKVEASGKTTEYTDKHSETNNDVDQYEKLAELHEEEGDYMNARLFYGKAIQYTTDSSLRKLYQLKIETLNINN